MKISNEYRIEISPQHWSTDSNNTMLNIPQNSCFLQESTFSWGAILQIYRFSSQAPPSNLPIHNSCISNSFYTISAHRPSCRFWTQFLQKRPFLIVFVNLLGCTWSHFATCAHQIVTHCSEDVPPSIVAPLLTPQCICLMSEEASAEEDQLWQSLGDAWNIPR